MSFYISFLTLRWAHRAVFIMGQGQLHLVKNWDQGNFLDVFHSGEYHERCFGSRGVDDIPDYTESFFDIPKRRDELLNGGSIYWLIDGFIQVRSDIWKIKGDKISTTTRPVATVWKRFRPTKQWDQFSDWEYLDAEDAPVDFQVGVTKAEEVPLAMREKYQELNLMGWFG